VKNDVVNGEYDAAKEVVRMVTPCSSVSLVSERGWAFWICSIEAELHPRPRMAFSYVHT
jgi:hypothetical protein